MAVTRLDSQIINMVNNIIAAEQDQVYGITLTLHSSIDRDFSYQVPFINNFLVIQNFTEESFDWAELTMKLNAAEYQQVSMHAQGLLATIKCQRRSMVETTMYEVVWQQTLTAVITSEIDVAITKGIPRYNKDKDTQLADSELRVFNLTIQLYETAAIQLRKYGAAFILKDVTVKQVVEMLVGVHQISNLKMSEPDNKKVYSQVLIPSSMTIVAAIEYLQDNQGFGIYNEGVTVYYHDDTLYVFPESKPGFNDNYTACQIIIVPDSGLSGLRSSHWVSPNNELFFIGGGNISQTEYTLASIENRGNTAYLLAQDKVPLAESRTVKRGKVTINPDLLSISGLESTWGLTENAYSPAVYNSMGNTCSIMTTLAVDLGSDLTIVWDNAIPWLIQPGHPIVCHYLATESVGATPAETKYVVRHHIVGICHRVMYSFFRNEQPSGLCYTCQASITIRIPAEKLE
jgi:hypothetical protein